MIVWFVSFKSHSLIFRTVLKYSRALSYFFISELSCLMLNKDIAKSFCDFLHWAITKKTKCYQIIFSKKYILSSKKVEEILNSRSILSQNLQKRSTDKELSSWIVDKNTTPHFKIKSKDLMGRNHGNNNYTIPHHFLLG